MPLHLTHSWGGEVKGRVVTGREALWASKSFVNKSFNVSILVSIEDFNEVNSSMDTVVDVDGFPELSFSSVTSGAILLLGG